MSTTVVHMAGPLIRFVDHQRQRCVWCGYVLVDEDLTRLAVQLNADGSNPGPPGGWPFEAFVEVTTEGGFRGGWIVQPHLHDDGSVIVPENGCMQMPPELTLVVEGEGSR